MNEWLYARRLNDPDWEDSFLSVAISPSREYAEPQKECSEFDEIYCWLLSIALVSSVFGSLCLICIYL